MAIDGIRNIFGFGNSLNIDGTDRVSYDIIHRGDVDVVIIDADLPEGALSAAKTIRSADESLPIVAIVPDGDVEQAVRLLKAGVNEIVTKPFGEGCLFHAMEIAVNDTRGRSAKADRKIPEALFGTSEYAVAARGAIERAMRNPGLPVLIFAEVGFDLQGIAEYLSTGGGKREERLLRLSLKEAKRLLRGKGKLPSSPIFIDISYGESLSSLPLLQRILRSPPEEGVTFRSIVAVQYTRNDRLDAAAVENYYHNNFRDAEGVPILAHLLPLRERRQDIEPLLDRIVERHSPVSHASPSLVSIAPSPDKSDAGSARLPSNVLRLLKNYAWPGNAIEMDRVLHAMLSSPSGATFFPSVSPDILWREMNRRRALPDVALDSAREQFSHELAELISG